MNESDPAAVPPAEPAHPTEPQAEVAASSSPSPGGDPGGGHRPDDGADHDGADHDGGGEGAATGEGDGEGGRKRRRRRRRRRKGGGEAGGDGAEGGETAEGVDSGEAPAEGEAEAAPRPQQQRQPKQKQGKQRREGGREHPRKEHGRDRRGHKDSQHSAMLAVRALADMAQALLRVEGVDPLAMPRYLDLHLRVPLDGGNDVRHAAGTAVEQILQRVRDVREHEKALRPGAVYSYFDDSSHAEGCRPKEPRQVFDGYTSTGKPNFADFVTLAIDRKDANIDRLLAGEEVILTHVTMGRVLRTQQLAEFGSASPVFKILGQVDAGLFRVLNDAGRCAFSFQLLRGSTLEGRVRLRLHAVGAVDPMDLADPALMQILSRFQRKLDGEALRLEGQLKHGEVDEEAFVLPLLQDLARQLQSRTRNAGRRTQHGLERSEEGQRPTSRAYPDAAEASDQAILWDIDQATVVVLGPKGRVHVFSPEGKHVTSVVMQGAAIERRRHQGRWRPAEPEERGEFRIRIKSMVAAGRDTTNEDAPLPDAGSV
ncbi:MAG: hypothetical protein H6835_07235 [Planctomycetes bacterium]|nr:hypothetical protein [Planctomycetota bacterium]